MRQRRLDMSPSASQIARGTVGQDDHRLCCVCGGLLSLYQVPLRSTLLILALRPPY